MANHAGIPTTTHLRSENHINRAQFSLTSITMRPTGLLSAVMSKKTRGRLIFSATVAKLRASNAKDDRLGRAVAPKWLKWLKVESIDSRQIDLNAMFKLCYLKNQFQTARSFVSTEQYSSYYFPKTISYDFKKLLCNKMAVFRLISIIIERRACSLKLANKIRHLP